MEFKACQECFRYRTRLYHDHNSVPTTLTAVDYLAHLVGHGLGPADALSIAANKREVPVVYCPHCGASFLLTDKIMFFKHLRSNLRVGLYDAKMLVDRLVEIVSEREP